uniref:Uncharacterized protein n=1 Tax=Oryza sativa subsp. japonica TaxID=39947 RepID=Q6ZL50_ORYSJ|nr:hypothetical protein [Oryza sativa Japonica Group]
MSCQLVDKSSRHSAARRHPDHHGVSVAHVINQRINLISGSKELIKDKCTNINASPVHAGDVPSSHLSAMLPFDQSLVDDDVLCAMVAIDDGAGTVPCAGLAVDVEAIENRAVLADVEAAEGTDPRLREDGGEGGDAVVGAEEAEIGPVGLVVDEDDHQIHRTVVVVVLMRTRSGGGQQWRFVLMKSSAVRNQGAPEAKTKPATHKVDSIALVVRKLDAPLPGAPTVET